MRGCGDYVFYMKFYMNNGITSLSLPNVTSLGVTSMYLVCGNSTSLRSVDLSGLLECGNASQGLIANNMMGAFEGCTSLESLDLRSLTTVGGYSGM